MARSIDGRQKRRPEYLRRTVVRDATRRSTAVGHDSRVRAASGRAPRDPTVRLKETDRTPIGVRVRAPDSVRFNARRLGTLPVLSAQTHQPAPLATLAEVRDRAERQHIRAVLTDVDNRIEEAAKRLGVARSTLFEKMRKLDIRAGS